LAFSSFWEVRERRQIGRNSTLLVVCRQGERKEEEQAILFFKPHKQRGETDFRVPPHRLELSLSESLV